MTQKENDGKIHIASAIIGGIFVLIAALIGGFFLIANTLCEQGRVSLCGDPTPVLTNQLPNTLIGVWEGNTKNGASEYEVVVTITNACKLGEVCGSFNITTIPCSGTFTLLDIKEDNTFIFLASNFQGICASGAEDSLQLLSDNTIRFTSRHPDYGENTGLLYKVEQ